MSRHHSSSRAARPAHLRLRHLILLLGLAGPWVQAAVTVTGPYGLDPWDPAPLNGQNLIRPNSILSIGTGGNGSFSALAGSVVDLAAFSLGQTWGAQSTGVLDGQGTALVLRADGNKNRFEVGNSGSGQFTISGGALLDGRAEGWKCLQGYQSCNTYIGGAAGSTGQLTVTGSGSEARFQNLFVIGNIHVNNTGFGLPGGTTTGRVQVLDGARLFSDDLSAGVSWSSPAANGQERSLAFVQIAGAGSLWEINGRDLGTGQAYANLGSGSKARTEVRVEAGGVLRLKPGGSNANLDLATQGAQAELTVDGGRVELLAGTHNFFGIGREGASQGSASLRNGAVVQMLGQRMDTQIGQGNGLGTMSLNNAQFLMDASQGSALGLGIEGGQGTLSLSNGSLWRQGGSDFGYAVVGRAGGQGRLELLSGSRFETGSIDLGSGRDGRGELWLDGAGSVLWLDRANGRRLAVGDWGQGTLTVSGGALLDATLNAAACLNTWCDSFIAAAAGSSGRLTITGAGSEARFLAGLVIGNTGLATQAIDGYTYGAPGGGSHGVLEVLDGATVKTERVYLGGWRAPSAIGTESSLSEARVSGAGSRWWISGNGAAGQDANLDLATQARADARVRIEAGGRLSVVAPAGRGAAINLSPGGQVPGGTSLLTVDGSGSRVDIIGDRESRLVVGQFGGGIGKLVVSNGGSVVQSSPSNSYLNIGEPSSIGTVELLSGGTLSGARFVNVGNGGSGSLLIDGAGSLLTTDRNGSFVGQLNVGTSGSGALTVRNGGLASAFSLQIGNGYGSDSGSVLIDGVGSRIETDALDWHRLAISNGSLTVSGGAVLDATINAAACNGHWCGTFLANNAGDHAVFTITGAGSRASFLSGFNVGMAYVTAPPGTAWTLGRPGETSTVQLNVLNGGRLETEGARIGQGPSGPAATGAEGVQAVVKLSGAGSVWDVRGGPGDGGQANFFTGTGGGANTQSDIQVRDGAQLRLHADSSHAAWIQLGIEGGMHNLLVSGPGAAVVYSDNNNAGLWIGRNGAIAGVKLTNGGQIQGVNRVQVGNTGATGSLLVDGVGSAISYGSSFADLYVGRQGGFGSAQVLHGGRVDLQGNAFTRLYVGDGTGADGASGTLRIDGAGSAVALQSPAFAAGSGWANPTGQIGWGGSGSVQIVNGGQLTLLGQGGSAPNAISSTRLTIGQAINGVTGSGVVVVSEAGSLLSVAGVDPITYVGRSGGFGTLSVNNGGEVRSTLLNVGADGATGNLNVNGGTLNLSGQWVSAPYGSILSLGYGNGSLGSAFFGNGAQVNITNMGSAGAGLLLGGINQSPKGSGALQVLNNSHVTISGQPGMNAVVVGLGGSGMATFDGGSSLTIAQGDVVVGQNASAVGTLRLLGGSTLTADYVGVGSTRKGDGGLGTLIVNDSVLSATTLEVGAKGYVGGNGTIIADVINRGIFSPGNSPGTLTLNGSFVNEAGGRLVLEVESDGQGGFVTDHLIFGGAGAPDLGSLQISFHFLGTTDPNAFQASGGFRIGSFMQQQGGAALDPQLFGGVTFSARADAYTISNFTFDAGSGALFSAQPVPEPATWGMLLLGLGVLWRRRVRSA
ncbi:PEP-CTERM sorting domain-containing protein [Paucibacter sediminis]|uniref:PEP-CTERM sorting domain-containing protein n=1 Tax=Paucibacter sediminis TaxID=3019553 RepID=A0AA95NCM6_9BURK|nr:PEP-CTERM sorting domain-containing protein [Paucibacter sp. S2-9]WIT12720.1 PEP-CTERM sorting domain-containing protein [Paucibacter sp. S2-9]